MIFKYITALCDSKIFAICSAGYFSAALGNFFRKCLYYAVHCGKYISVHIICVEPFIFPNDRLILISVSVLYLLFF